MTKRKYRFGLEYLDQYVSKVFTYKIRKDGDKRYAIMRITPRKHRDAQQWAYVPKAEGKDE